MKALSKIWLAVTLALCSFPLSAQNEVPSGQQQHLQKVLGSVTAMENDIVTISSPSGMIQVQVPGSAQIVRAEPGQRDLKQAAPIALKDVQVGDHVLARVTPASGSAPAVAASLIVMRSSDIAQKQQRDISDWQEHGAGGLVTFVDAAS